MEKFQMIEFGRTLTGRDLGKAIASKITDLAEVPIILDFKGVIAVGSSCGDEIVSAIASRQDGKIHICNANGAIQSLLALAAKDANAEIVVISEAKHR